MYDFDTHNTWLCKEQYTGSKFVYWILKRYEEEVEGNESKKVCILGFEKTQVHRHIRGEFCSALQNGKEI